MTPEKVSNALLSLEKQYWNAIKNRDTDTMKRLTTDPCVVVGAQGVGEVDRKTLGAMMENATWNLTDYRFDDVHVRQVADDVAVVAYKVKEKLVVDGKDLTLDVCDSSVWVQRDGEWLCAVHTESVAGDPFGRN